MFLKGSQKLGENLRMWTTKLKIAIIEKNTDALSKLLEDVPKFNPADDAKEIEEAMYLLREASILLHTLQDETVVSMRQIKNNLSFLKSMQVNTAGKLDVTS